MTAHNGDERIAAPHTSRDLADESIQQGLWSKIKTAFYNRVSIAMTVWLTVLWLLLFGRISWIHFLSGVFLALIAQIFFPLPKITRNWRVRLIPCIIWITRFMWDVARAGCQVSWIVLKNKPTVDAIIRVDMYSSSPVHLTIQSAMTSLIPGSLVLRVDRLSGTLYLHVLDLPGQGGAMAVRKAIHAQEKRMLWAIAPLDELPNPLWPSRLKRWMLKGRSASTDKPTSIASPIDPTGVAGEGE